MIIDAHHHFWQPERGDYGWLTPALKPLYRDFLPDDLKPILEQSGIDGTILVQAAPTIAETEYLLHLADENPIVLGVVGWVDFAAETAAKDIARLAMHPKLVGLRPMIQDIPDDDWMLGAALTPAFDALIEHDLAFDALVLPRHLSRLHKLLTQHPQLRTIIDHGAKPNIAKGQFDTWAKDIAVIANESDAYCKISGLVTEAGEDWTDTDLAPYVAHLLENFGPKRLVWGSDWPVLNLASSYQNWWELAQSFVSDRSAKDAIFGSNAVDFYKLGRRLGFGAKAVY